MGGWEMIEVGKLPSRCRGLIVTNVGSYSHAAGLDCRDMVIRWAHQMARLVAMASMLATCPPDPKGSRVQTARKQGQDDHQNCFVEPNAQLVQGKAAQRASWPHASCDKCLN